VRQVDDARIRRRQKHVPPVRGREDLTGPHRPDRAGCRVQLLDYAAGTRRGGPVEPPTGPDQGNNWIGLAPRDDMLSPGGKITKVHAPVVVDPGHGPSKRSTRRGYWARPAPVGARGCRSTVRPGHDERDSRSGGQRESHGQTGEPPAAAPSPRLGEQSLGCPHRARARWGDRAAHGRCQISLMELLSLGPC
jgi:hypothetical protein